MSRVVLLVLDSLGVGGARDAGAHGDAGADTLGHLAQACVDHRPEGPLRIPHLERLGLGAAARAATGRWPAGLGRREGFEGAWGCCDEVSEGKDTPSGHWEIAGLPVPYAWHVFPPGPPSFPPALLEALVERAGLPGVLGDRAMSGTAILDLLGAEHLATGKPIVYTSADSVFQVAAHEASFGLERLYDVCRIARDLVDAWQVGRVIARPFVGEPGAFRRTVHRRDYTTPPHGATLLDRVVERGGHVIGIGKIPDIFAHRGITRSVKAGGNDAVFDATLAAMDDPHDPGLVFANFVDFDTLYGHRRDVPGYAGALEAFDRRVPEIEARLGPEDLVVLTADHGCDPTWPGTDHTRERIPLVCFGPRVRPGPLGVREVFADIGQSVATWLGVGPLAAGRDAGLWAAGYALGEETP